MIADLVEWAIIALGADIDDVHRVMSHIFNSTTIYNHLIPKSEQRRYRRKQMFRQMRQRYGHKYAVAARKVNYVVPENFGRIEAPVTKDDKVDALEEELMQLKAEMAKLLSRAAKEDQMIEEGPGNDTLDEMAVDVMAAAPPPPPPAPAPKYDSQSLVPKPLQFGKKRKAETGKQETSNTDLMQELKSGGVIRLKKVKVDRSPGGTPKKDAFKYRSPKNQQDILSHALKKKFDKARHNSNTPASPRDQNNTFALSPVSPIQNRFRKASVPSSQSSPLTKSNAVRTENNLNFSEASEEI